MLRRLLPALLLLLLPVATRAATIPAASCSSTDVQTAINSSANGDTVQLPLNSSCAWGSASTSGLTYTGVVNLSSAHQITLDGNGSTITFTGSGTDPGFAKTSLSVVTGLSNAPGTGTASNTIIKGFNFVGAYINGRFPIVIITGPGNLPFRFTGNTINGIPASATALGMYGAGGSTGLVDLNTFSTTGNFSEIIHAFGSIDNNDNPGNQTLDWSSSVVPGSLNSIYVERNIFTSPADPGQGQGTEAMEVFAGARVVFRNNTLTNVDWDAHGGFTGNPSNCSMVNTRWYELYNNGFTYNGTHTDSPTINLRGGSGVAFGNTHSGLGGVIQFQADCISSTSGVPYPYQDQDGRGITTSSGSSTTNLSPIYLWNNGTFTTNVTSQNLTPTTYIQQNRDFFLLGPTGITRCESAADVAAGCPVTYNYVPAQFPYPFTGGGVTPPSPPTNLVGTASGSTANLSWTASSGTPTPTAYTLYRGTVHNGPYTAISSGITTVSTTDSPANGTYFYVVTAYVGGIVSTIAGNGTTATVTCTTSCAFPSGAVITIAGDSVAAFNGTFTSTGQPTSTTFTFASSTNSSGAGGGVWQPAGESTRSNEAQVVVGAPITVSFTPASLAFASFTVGTSSPTQTVTVKNTSSAGTNVTFSSISPTGANPGDFIVQAADPLAASNKPAIDTTCTDYPSNIWVNGPYVKVLQNAGTVPACTNGSFALGNGSKWGLFYGTQNETVDFQVHFHDSGGGTTGYQVTVSAFTQTSPSSFSIHAPDSTHTDIIAYREAYVNVATQVTSIANTFYNTLGQYPDILIPAIDPYYHQTTNAFPFTISAGNNQSAWVDVHIPSAAPSGYYSGTVTVQSGCPSTCVTVATLPIIIAVWQWPSSGSMPSTSSLTYFTGSGFQDLCVQAYGSYAACNVYPGAGGSSDTAINLMITTGFGPEMLDHHISSADPIYPPPSTNFTSFQSSFGPLFNGTASTILSGAKLTTAQYAWGNGNFSFLQNWATEFQSQGWIPKTYFNYTCDEPPGTCAWSDINTRAASLHATTPPTPSLVTTNLAKATANSVLNGIDIMVPIINDLDPQGGTLQRSTYNTWLSGSAGPTRVLWSYQSCSSTGTCGNGTVGPANATWPNVAIDGIPVANRAMEWMSYRNGVSGELYFAATYCWQGTNCTNGSAAGSDPWVDEYSFGGWGSGTFFYPGTTAKLGAGVTTPFYVPSMRLKAIRDGMQDYEYLNVLNKNGQGATVTSAINSWITNSSAFNTTLSPSGSFTSDLPDARFTLGQAIHQLTFATLCGGTLASGASCNVSVTFTPTAAGARSASLTFVDNATGSPQTVPLSGTGLAPAAAVTLTPGSLTFQPQLLTTTSPSQPIVLQNSGTGTLSISSISASGDFGQTNTCGATLSAGNTCTISVTFTPTVAGARTGSVSVTDNAAGSPHTASLTGTGIQVRCSITGTTVLTGITIVCHP